VPNRDCQKTAAALLAVRRRKKAGRRNKAVDAFAAGSGVWPKHLAYRGLMSVLRDLAENKVKIR
jgi:hypothetical protein